MSCNYADGLSPYRNKGKLGLKEKFDSAEDVASKVAQLAVWINESKHTVIHTGAGISTSAGIPDFRGPNGVWTLEERGLKPDINVSFNDAIPTKTHMAIVKLVQSGKVQYVVSQNIDGLHVRSGLPRSHIAELHGNMFTEKCSQCDSQFVRQTATTSVGQKCLLKPCPSVKRNGRMCRGRLHDTILDWEHNLPENDLGMADFHSCIADLSICLGTTLQIVPSGSLPLYTKKFGGRLVICNLQPTKHDKKADLLIHSYVDDIMVQLMKFLDLPIPEYTKDKDPTKLFCGSKIFIDWTIQNSSVKLMRNIYESKCCKQAKKREIKEEVKQEKDLDFKNIKRSKLDDKQDSNIAHSTESAKESTSVIKTEPKEGNNRDGNNLCLNKPQDNKPSGSAEPDSVVASTSRDIKTEVDESRTQDGPDGNENKSQSESPSYFENCVTAAETSPETVEIHNNTMVNESGCENNVPRKNVESSHDSESTVISTDSKSDDTEVKDDAVVNASSYTNNELNHESESTSNILIIDAPSDEIHKNVDVASVTVQS